ncbi:restriction endonuclease subunit S [Kutzneria sp. 744]|uniref:restriction endonuclease subunit S n=1 Tax=Kutzneria sp. (strain 744) TaxID=345341 RepID=UPI000A048733|nr:restriction endonuclease subunit S [Kutzneria sp. 744]
MTTVRSTSPTKIDWLQGLSLPSGWSESKVKYVAPGMQAGEAITAESIEPVGTYPVYGGNGLRGYTQAKTHHGTRILIGRQGALCGNVHLVSGEFWASEHAIVARASDEVDPRWLAYLLRVMNLGQYSQTAAQPGIGTAQINALPVPVPPHSEQRAIADYLDRETARIDTLIEEQQRLVELVRERREAEADALLGSPIETRHTTVKRVLRPLSRPAAPGLGVVTAFRDGVVTLRSNRREDGYTFSNTEHGYQEIRPGDLVFHALDGFAGAVGISDSHGNATPVYHVCEASAGDHLPYVARLLRYLGRSGFLATQAPNVRERSVDFRNWSMFGRLPLALPPVEEQRRIAEHLDEQTAKIDTLIAETERFIELSKERRAALITAAVTGQIDVREMA